MKSRYGWIGLSCAAILVFTACGKPASKDNEASAAASTLSGKITIDGSSTVLPISEALAEEFQKQHPQVEVTVGRSGTGGGFKKFANGEIDITGASRPIREEEDAQCKKNGIEYIEIPIAYDAMAVVVNPQNTWCDTLTVAELKKIWEPAAQGKITNWSQVRPGFPNERLVLFGAGTDSGTFDYFTAAIVGKEKASRGDYTASEDDDSLNPLHKGGPSGPYAPILPHFEPELQVPIPNPLTHESNFDDSEGGSESFWRGAASTSRAKAHGQTIRRTTKWSTAASQTESLGLSEVPKRTRTCAVGVT